MWSQTTCLGERQNKSYGFLWIRGNVCYSAALFDQRNARWVPLVLLEYGQSFSVFIVMYFESWTFLLAPLRQLKQRHPRGQEFLYYLW
jgi:hypothetical protein